MENNRPVAKVIEVWGNAIDFTSDTSLADFGSMSYDYTAWTNWDSASMITSVRRYLDWGHLQPLPISSSGEIGSVIFSLYDEGTTLYDALWNIYYADGHILSMGEFLEYHADDLMRLDTWDIASDVKHTIMVALNLISDSTDIKNDRTQGKPTIYQDIPLYESATDLLKLHTHYYYDDAIMALCRVAFSVFTEVTGNLEVCDEKEENIYPDKVTTGMYVTYDENGEWEGIASWEVHHPTE